MSRLPSSFFAVVVALLLATTVGAPANAAPAPNGGLPVSWSVDDDLGDLLDPADEDDPADEPVDLDLGDLCTLNPAGDDPVDEPDEAAARSLDDGDAPGDEAADAEDDPLGCDDDDDAEEADDPDEAASGGSKTVGLAAILAKGVVSTGSVSLSGPGTVTQELWLNRAGGAKVRSASIAAVRKGATAKKAPKGKGKGKGKAKSGGKLLAGSITRTVKRAGTVTLTVRLNSAARSELRKGTKQVRIITIKTVTKVVGQKARTKTGTVVVRRKAG